MAYFIQKEILVQKNQNIYLLLAFFLRRFRVTQTTHAQFLPLTISSSYKLRKANWKVDAIFLPT